MREEKLLPLEEAIRKMTSLPASRMRLAGSRDRCGRAWRPTSWPSIPRACATASTYADPRHYSEGIPYVAVNGQLVVDEGRLTAARPAAR